MFVRKGSTGWAKRYCVYFVLAVFMLVGTVLRLYRADELMVFNGDQGRDVTIVARMMETGQPTLLGPGSSAGNFRRGPAYYYLLTPAMWLGGGEPLSAFVFIVLIDDAAVAVLVVLSLFSAARLGMQRQVWGFAADSYGTVRAVVEKIQEASGGEPFVFHYTVAIPVEAFASPYTFLMKRAGARLTMDARAMQIASPASKRAAAPDWKTPAPPVSA